MHTKPEILSPAGSLESIYAALNNGCDAIYLGGKNFNARQYASNFSDEELNEIIDLCHLYNVKVLITLNILYKNNEINDVLEFVSKMYEFGADAFIIQDIGIFNLIKSNFPKINLHASTQMTIHNVHGVNFLQKLGFKRIVLSRELSLNEINLINKNTSAETEVFVHGALCVCYSGRCLMSSLIGERSGNRGRCAQPCRLKYKLLKNGKIIKDGYLLSPKDVMGINSLKGLSSAGVHTLKIEGRMKSPEYVAKVTSVYRKYNDLFYSDRKVNEAEFEVDIKQLTQIFNRGGSFTEGYFNNWGGTDMISPSPKSSGIQIGKVLSFNKKTSVCTILLTENVVPGDGIEIWTSAEPHAGTSISKKAYAGEKITIPIKSESIINKNDLVFKSYDKALNDSLKKSYEKITRKREVAATVKALLGKPLYIKLETQNLAVEAFGEQVASAQKQPVTKAIIKDKLSKTGNTPFTFNFKEIIADENIYVNIKAINELKREAVQKLENSLKNHFKREKINVTFTPIKRPLSAEKLITVQVSSLEQFYEALNYKVKRIYLDFPFNEGLPKEVNSLSELAHQKGISLFIALPRIYRSIDDEKYSKILTMLEESKIDGYLIRNYPPLETKKEIVADYTFNIFNSASLSVFSEMFDTVTLSPELNINELSELASENTELFVYGRLPLMTTHQCPVGLFAGEKKHGRFCSLKGNTEKYYLNDRKNTSFPIERDCSSCTAAILNSAPVFTAHRFDKIKALNASFFRLTFTDESKELTSKILRTYTALLYSNEKPFKLNELIEQIKELGFTNGHFFRGVL